MLGRVQASPASPVRVAHAACSTRSLDTTCDSRRERGRGPRFGGTLTKGHAVLEIYSVVLQLVRLVRPHLVKLKGRSASLGDQLERALVSIPLNVAEGAYSRGRNREAHFQRACASAREAQACLETAEALGWMGPVDAELNALFYRVIGTLVRLTLPKGA